MAHCRHRWLLAVALLAAVVSVAAQNPPQPPSPPLSPGGDANPAPPQPGQTPAPSIPQGEFGPTVEPSFAPTQGQPTQAPTPTVDQPTQAPTPGQPTQAPTQEQLTQAPTPVQLTAVPTSASGNFNPKDVTALLEQKQAITNAGSVNQLNSWVQGGNPCENWGGVSCDESGAVVGLDLTGLSLQGSLAGGLSGAATLQSLKLGQNQLDGSLPGEWASGSAFQSLTELDVSANQLEGDLPVSYGAQGSFPGLQLLRLGSNAFTGSLPAAWGDSGGFGVLQNLLLESNELEGELPPEWGSSGRFGALARLDISRNDLEGSIPADWGGSNALPSLTDLVLKPGNPTLCGAIPGDLAVLPPNAVSNGKVVCGDTPPAPEPVGEPPAPGAAAGAGGDNTVGAAFDVAGNGLVPWTEAANQTFASAVKLAIGDEFNSTVIRYVGNVPNNSTSSGRKLLQSQGITVYYNLEQVSDPAVMQAKLREQNTLSLIQDALSQNGVNANSVTINDIEDGGITVPGQSSGGGSSSLSTGAIAGIAIGAALVVLLILLLLICCCLRRRKRRRGAYPDAEVMKAGTPIVRPQSTFRNDADGGPSGGLTYYRRKGSPTASPQHSGSLPQGLPQMAQPIMLNVDNVAYQGQRVQTGPSPRSASPSQSPMYPTVKPTDDIDEAPAPAGKASKFSSWWTGRSAVRAVEEAPQSPMQSPFSPQITPENDVELDIPQGGAYNTPGAGGGRVADWLQPGGSASPSPSGPQPIERTGSQKKKLSSVVSDIDAI